MSEVKALCEKNIRSPVPALSLKSFNQVLTFISLENLNFFLPSPLESRNCDAFRERVFYNSSCLAFGMLFKSKDCSLSPAQRNCLFYYYFDYFLSCRLSILGF